MKKLKSALFNLLLSVVSLTLVVIVLEVATRLIWSDEYTNWYDHRKAQPEPYKDSEYFYDEFFDQPGKWINPEGTRIIYPSNYKGKHFNVVDNKRATTNHPDNLKNEIYLFGGSTVYGGEVPDSLTIASHLQRIINQSLPNEYRVNN